MEEPANPLALAIVDVVLEDMAGHELVGPLKVIDATVPVIMTADDRGAESEILARQTGIVCYLPKPIDLAGLETIVHRLTA